MPLRPPSLPPPSEHLMNFRFVQRPLALALALAASAAIAAPGAAAPESGLPTKMPPDVHRAEFLKKAAAHFDLMDADHDGTLTGAEQVEFFKARRAEMIRKLDAAKAAQGGKPQPRDQQSPGARFWPSQEGARKAPPYVQP